VIRMSRTIATTAIKAPATTKVVRGPSSVPARPPSTIATSELPRIMALTVASTRPRQKSGVRPRTRVVPSTFA